jgi:hypothetical protein
MHRFLRHALVYSALFVSVPAVAGELDVAYEAKPAGKRGAMTYLDVAAGKIPAIELMGPEGRRFRMALSLRPDANSVVTIEGVVEEIVVKRNGKVQYVEVARPIVSTTDGDPASISFSPKKAKGLSFEVTLTPRLDRALNRPPMVEREDIPDAEPEAEPAAAPEAEPVEGEAPAPE